jgi:hypothetical protein
MPQCPRLERPAVAAQALERRNEELHVARADESEIAPRTEEFDGTLQVDFDSPEPTDGEPSGACFSTR